MGQNVGNLNYLEHFGKSTLILVKSYAKNPLKTFSKKKTEHRFKKNVSAMIWNMTHSLEL